MSPSQRSPARRATVTEEAESWFLERGLPSLLTTRGRWRRHSARAAGDDDYRSNFVDPLIDDLHATLTARNRYRNRMANAPVTSVDGADLGD